MIAYPEKTVSFYMNWILILNNLLDRIYRINWIIFLFLIFQKKMSKPNPTSSEANSSFLYAFSHIGSMSRQTTNFEIKSVVLLSPNAIGVSRLSSGKPGKKDPKNPACRGEALAKTG
jgi:hypothetical protein